MLAIVISLTCALAPQGSPLAPPGLDDLPRLARGQAHRIGSGSDDPTSNADFVPIASGAEITLADLQGPGTIRRLWLTCESDDPYYSRLLVLRAKWDDESTPSIEVPVGDFFGAGHALDVDVATEPMRVSGDGRARVCWLPMPFQKSAYLALRNDSPRPVRLAYWSVDWVEGTGGAPAGYLHAQFRISPRERTLQQHRVAEITGAGSYVGTVLSIWSGEEGWPGEGDDRFFLDGESTPSMHGAGLEDYFGEAWGFRAGTGPWGGVTVWEGTGAGARTSAVRWHVRDPVPFQKGLVVTFERQGYALRNDVWKVVHERNDSFSSVGFWYQQEPHGPMAALVPQAERLPFYEVRIEPEEKETFATLLFDDEGPKPAVQRGNFWAYGGQVRFAPDSRRLGNLALPFDVPGPREYDLYLRLTRGPDAGAWEALVDGERIGAPFDLHSPRVSLREVLLGRLHLKPGGHVLELRCVGKALESTGHALGLDSFMVRWLP